MMKNPRCQQHLQALHQLQIDQCPRGRKGKITRERPLKFTVHSVYEIINTDSPADKISGHLRPQIVQGSFLEKQVIDAFRLGLVGALDGEFIVN